MPSYYPGVGLHRFVLEQHRELYRVFYKEVTGRPLDVHLVHKGCAGNSA